MVAAGVRSRFADVARTHPCVYGVWLEKNGTYTVAVKAEALRAGKKHEKGREGDPDSAWLPAAEKSSAGAFLTCSRCVRT